MMITAATVTAEMMTAVFYIYDKGENSDDNRVGLLIMIIDQK